MAKANDAWGDVLGKVGKEVGDTLQNAMLGRKSNGTYKAINHLGNNYLGGVEVINRMVSGQGVGKAFDKTFRKNAKDASGKLIKDADGKIKRDLDVGKIAGSYLGVSAAARIASGGGVYKDGNGNGNLIGVPFI